MYELAQGLRILFPETEDTPSILSVDFWALETPKNKALSPLFAPLRDWLGSKSHACPFLENQPVPITHTTQGLARFKEPCLSLSEKAACPHSHSRRRS